MLFLRHDESRSSSPSSSSSRSFPPPPPASQWHSKSSTKEEEQPQRQRRFVSDNHPQTKSATTTTTTTLGLGGGRRRVGLKLGCWWCVELPLVLLITACCVLLGIQSIYETYYIPLLDRSTRSNADLQHEYTYYHRRCTARDVTTRNLTQLLVAQRPNRNNNHNNDTTTTSTSSSTTTSSTTTKTTIQTAQDLLLTHGAVVIPQILSPETVHQLRAYAVARNAAIADHEQYPVSQGHNRLSFGYDATEHPAVVQAVRDITHHAILQPLLQHVLGDVDPASTELTTITQYAGAPPQAWHSDTKADGNALQFARTYSHSYSLFVPLQHTTARMGPTDICPGTQYCANDLSDVCELYGGRGLHTAYASPRMDQDNDDDDDETDDDDDDETDDDDEAAFPAGDGALLNQHVWHRGAPHRDPDAPERIMLVLSFMARPRRGDPRQLSRGTYFHQKWNMWGHTWQDLQDPVKYMTTPWSYLKCFSLYSSSGSWGYDLVTAVYLRVANGQYGHDLTRLVQIWDDILEWPTWLHGRNWEYQVSEKEAWQRFVQETLDIWWSQLLYPLTMGLHVLYLVVFATVYCWTRNDQPIRSSLRRYVVGNGLVVITFAMVAWRIHQTPWAQDTVQGKTLMRPFPVTTTTATTATTTTTTTTYWPETLWNVVSTGPTTFPTTTDVLVGTRFDAPWLGAYEQWLEGHPGNQAFRQVLHELAPLYQWVGRRTGSYHVVEQWNANLGQSVWDELVVRNGGGGNTTTTTTAADHFLVRMLQQDYRTGDWRVLSREERQRQVQWELACAASPLLAALRTTTDRSIALYRFGSSLRTSSLAQHAAVYAWWFFRHSLVWKIPLSRSLAQPTHVRPVLKSEPNVEVSNQSPFLARRGGTAVPPVSRLSTSSRISIPTGLTRRLGGSFLVQKKQPRDFTVGQAVWVQLLEFDPPSKEESFYEWYRGDILALDAQGRAAVALETGEVESNVSPTALARYQPVQAGDRVRGCFAYQNYLHHYYPRGGGDEDEDDDDDEEEPRIPPPPPKLNDCYDGTVVRVMPDGAVAIQYDDGDYDARKALGEYYIPPFQAELYD